MASWCETNLGWNPGGGVVSRRIVLPSAKLNVWKEVPRQISSGGPEVIVLETGPGACWWSQTPRALFNTSRLLLAEAAESGMVIGVWPRSGANTAGSAAPLTSGGGGDNNIRGRRGWNTLHRHSNGLPTRRHYIYRSRYRLQDKPGHHLLGGRWKSERQLTS
jgi:hypothetical protein